MSGYRTFYAEPSTDRVSTKKVSLYIVNEYSLVIITNMEKKRYIFRS